MNNTFSALKVAPKDPIFSINEAFNADTNPEKINLAIGVYLNDAGKIPLMRAVQLAEVARQKKPAAHPYLPIEGMKTYDEAVKQLLFGDSFADHQIVTVQALGGTGALNAGSRFLKQLLPDSVVAISNPSWENHRSVFEHSGFKVVEYPYYDAVNRAVNFSAMLASLQELPPKSIIILHACCHNPTGMDLSPAEWQQVIATCKEKDLVPFLDMAYQGFAVDLMADSTVVREFAQAGLSFLVANSFSKTFSLYGERVGALSVVTQEPSEATAVLSHVKRWIRAIYSNPPTYGAALVSDILHSAELRVIWEQELGEMRERIKHMRHLLATQLSHEKQDFSFINTQNGMFSYSGLTAEQVERLRHEHSIYALLTGRICIAALTSHNFDRVVASIKSVLT